MAGGIGTLMVMLLMLGGFSGIDVVSLLDSETFWRVQKVEVTTANMIKILKARKAARFSKATLEKSLKDLGHEDPKVRRLAGKRLFAIRRPALPSLDRLAQANDPEVALTAKALIAKIKASQQSVDQISRLMAIRELGRLKAETALPLLKALGKSRDVFVKEYSKEAVNKIMEVVPKPKRVSKALDKKVGALPADCGLVLRLSAMSEANFLAGIEKMIAQMPPGMGGGVPAQPQSSFKVKMTEEILKAGILQKIGNIRLDSILAGVSESTQEDKLHATFLIRGVFNVNAIFRAILEAAPESADIVRKRIGKRTALVMEQGHVKLIAISNRTVLIITSGDPKAYPTQQVLASYSKDMKKGLTGNGKMAELIEQVDRDGPLWAVVKLGAGYQKGMPLIKAFDRVLFSTKMHGKLLDLKIEVVGRHPIAVGMAAGMIEKKLKEAKTNLAEMMMMMPMLKPMHDSLNSIKLETFGKSLTITARTDMESLFSVPLGLAFMVSASIRPMLGPGQMPGPPIMQPLNEEEAMRKAEEIRRRREALR